MCMNMGISRTLLALYLSTWQDTLRTFYFTRARGEDVPRDRQYPRLLATRLLKEKKKHDTGDIYVHTYVECLVLKYVAS